MNYWSLTCSLDITLKARWVWLKNAKKLKFRLQRENAENIRHWCISNLLFSLRYLKFLILIRVFFHHHWISVCSINLIRMCARMKRCMQLLTPLWGDRSWGHINHYWDSWRSIPLICLGKPFTKSWDGQDLKEDKQQGSHSSLPMCALKLKQSPSYNPNHHPAKKKCLVVYTFVSLCVISIGKPSMGEPTNS